MGVARTRMRLAAHKGGRGVGVHAGLQHPHACMHARTRVHTHARMHARTHACTHTCTHARTPARAHAHAHTQPLINAHPRAQQYMLRAFAAMAQQKMGAAAGQGGGGGMPGMAGMGAMGGLGMMGSMPMAGSMPMMGGSGRGREWECGSGVVNEV